MRDEGSHEPPRAFDTMERDVIYLLTNTEDGQPIWSVEDIGREIETDEPMILIRGLLRPA